MMNRYLTGIYHNEALLYLGYKGGQVPPEIAAQLELAERELLEKSQVRVVYRVFDCLPDGTVPGLGFALQGQDMARLLSDCHTIILFGATLGTAIERYSRQLQVRDMGYAVVFDAAANSAIENVCDNFCRELADRYGHTTDRFSPGYGDLPFAQQQEFNRVLQLQQTIGVSLTATGLMVPQKSVTAVLGVADTPQPRRFRGCPHCNLFRSCTLRKEGRVCGRF